MSIVLGTTSPQPIRIISRKGAKAARCHFDRREKSISDPSPSLGMTDRGLSPLRAWRLGGIQSGALVARSAWTGRKWLLTLFTFWRSACLTLTVIIWECVKK